MTQLYLCYFNQHINSTEGWSIYRLSGSFWGSTVFHIDSLKILGLLKCKLSNITLFTFLKWASLGTWFPGKLSDMDLSLLRCRKQRDVYHCECTINDGMTHARTFDLLYSEISRYLINIRKAQFIFRHAFVIQLKESLPFQTLNYLNVITALKRIFAESLKDV